MSGECGERIPPCDIVAERAVLGSCLLEGEVAALGQELLTSEDFYRSAHRLIFKAIQFVIDSGALPDEITVREKLDSGGKLEQAGGADYLHELATSVPSTANFERYCSLVKATAVQRRLIIALTKSLQEAYSPGDLDGMLERCQRSIASVAQRAEKVEISSIADVLQDAFSELERRHQAPGVVTGLSTGFPELDKLTSGFHPGEFIVLGGRPNIGKTALVLTILERLAREKPCLLLSLEMGTVPIAHRLISLRSGVASRKFQTGMLDPTEWNTVIEKGMTPLGESKLFLDYTPGLTLPTARRIISDQVSRHQIEIAAIDYLQIMSAPRAQNRERQVAELSMGLKHLAGELNIPIIAVSQLRRPPADRSEKRGPGLTDLRESGTLEQDADLVLLLHRERDEETHLLDAVTDLFVAKQRNGPLGSVPLTFLDSITKFASYASKDLGEAWGIE